MERSSSLANGRPLKKASFTHFCFYSTAVMLWFTVACLVPSSVLAQTPAQTQSNLKLHARSFYDGNFKYGDWLPIEINLENYGEAVVAQVETTITNSYTGSTTNTTYRREVSLGQRANKRFILYIQPYVQNANVSRGVSYEAKVQLLVNRQKLDEQAVKLLPIDPKDYLVGTITLDGKSLLGLNNLKVGGMKGRVTAVSLTLADIPDLAEGLHSLNSLVISETATDNLSGPQRSAIKNWVGSGGQLLLMGGNGWSRVREAFDSSFLPFDVLDFINISDVSGLLPVPGEHAVLAKPVGIARGQILQGATGLSFNTPSSGVNTPIPLITERRVGSGRVIATAIDLTSQVVQDWADSNRVWQDLFSFNAGTNNSLYSEQNPQLKNAADFMGIVSSVPELQLPSLLPFLLVFGLYVLVISPINYFLLKYLKHLEWGWFTIPFCLVVCTLTTFQISKNQLPGQVLINQMSVVQLGSGQEQAQVKSYAALFSQEDRRYQVMLFNQEGTSQALMVPMSRANSVNTPENEVNRVVVEGEKTRLDGLTVGQWGAQGFGIEASVPGSAFILNSSLSFQPDKEQTETASIKGTLRNSTSFTIRNVFLILGDFPQKLKDVIEPGEAVPVDFKLPSPTASAPAYCSTTYSSYGAFPPQSAGDRLSNLMLQDRADHRDDKLIANRASFLKKVFESGRYSPLNPQRGIDLVGWIDQNPLPLVVDGVSIETKASQLLVERLPVSNQSQEGESQLFFPGTYFWPENSFSESGLSALSNRADRTDEVCVNKENVISQFRVPAGQGAARVKQLTLYLNSHNANSQRTPVLPSRIEIYDWQVGKWQVLSGLINSGIQVSNGNYGAPPPPKPNVITDAERYVETTSGRILLRFSSDSAASNLLTQFSLSIEASR